MNKIVTTIALAVALCGLHFGALGQPYPSRPVRMIMPFPPGGSTDVLGRIVAEQLTSAFGQPVLVDNRAGASAQIGTEVVAKAAPDGYTLLAGTSTNAINHALNPKLPYDFSKDFAPIALVMSAGQVLVVHPSVPARTVREFIAYAKERTAPLPYASSGSGASGHLAMEALANEAKIKMLHVPYKGNAPALNDLLAGQVLTGFANISTVMQHITAGKLRAIGISSAKRSALAPDVPTIAELGFAGFDVTGWLGLMAPVGVPAAVIARLNTETVKALKGKSTRDKFLALGVDPAPFDSADDFARFIQADISRWQKVAREANLKLD